MTSPILIGCARGTHNEAGLAVVRGLLDEVRAALPEVQVREAYTDRRDPALSEELAGIPVGEELSVVVVPLILAAGHHVHHDIASAVDGRDDVKVAGALGPDPRLVRILTQRLAEAGVTPEATVVLAPAGSSDERSQNDTSRAAEMLRTAWRGPVRLGFAGDFHPDVVDAVTKARAFGEEDGVAVASYLLTTGAMQDRLAQVGADTVTAPLAPHPVLADIVIDRYREACGG